MSLRHLHWTVLTVPSQPWVAPRSETRAVLSGRKTAGAVGNNPIAHIRSLWGQRATCNSEGGMKTARLAWGVTTSKSSGLGPGDQCGFRQLRWALGS